MKTLRPSWNPLSNPVQQRDKLQLDQHQPLEPTNCRDTLVKKGIKWKFNPSSAPHHVASNVFYAVLGNRCLIDEILTTKFCLVKQWFNARPITPVSPEATDLDAFTPNHFLLGTASSTLPSHCSSELRRNLESLS